MIRAYIFISLLIKFSFLFTLTKFSSKNNNIFWFGSIRNLFEYEVSEVWKHYLLLLKMGWEMRFVTWLSLNLKIVILVEKVNSFQVPLTFNTIDKSYIPFKKIKKYFGPNIINFVLVSFFSSWIFEWESKSCQEQAVTH